MKYLPYIVLGLALIGVIYLVTKKDENAKRVLNFQPIRVKIY